MTRKRGWSEASPFPPCQASWLRFFVRVVPSDRVVAGLYRFYLYLRYVVRRIASEGLGPIDMMRLAALKVFSGVKRLRRNRVWT